jgi:hypothetical protein
MKRTHESFDPEARMIPRDWITRAAASGRGDDVRENEPYKWMTTLPAPLDEMRRYAIEALTEANTTVAYLYETEEKVVIRCTLPQRQIRAELKSLDAHATRIVVVTMRDGEFDRATSGRIVEAIEHKLQDAGNLTQS